jgi:bifunctional lysine-specific demethylase and histidyl-hydroxylase NO66
MNALARLGALLAPLTPAAFFDRYWEREPLHLPAEAGRARPLLTSAALLAALGGRSEPPEGLTAFPEHFDRGEGDAGALVRDAGRLAAYLDAGHPLVWDRARGVSAEVDALAAALGEALGAHVWPNVYATGTAGTPFDMHFDAHEVFAVHCEGHKEWVVSAVRVDRPLDAVEMEPAVRAALTGRRDEAEARPLLRFTVGPGSVVYVPRGQFHNASTPAGRSLHVTFGVRMLTGFDVAQILARIALADPALREFLPPAAADPGGERAAAQLAGALARLGGILASEGLARAALDAQASLVARSRTAASVAGGRAKS